MNARSLSVALVVLALFPAPARAHAELESTSPEAGAQLARSPGSVELRFGEAVEASFGRDPRLRRASA